MTVPDEERLARALLTRIAEPGDELLGRLVAELGAAGAVDAIRTATSYPLGLAVAGDAGPGGPAGAAPKRPAGSEPTSRAGSGSTSPVAGEPERAADTGLVHPAGAGTGRPAEAVRRFAAWRARLPDADPDRLLAAAEELGGRLVCPGDAEWPSQLGDLGAAQPLALWVRGDLDLRFACLRSVAIVGSRSATAYGVHVAAELAAGLADRGWCTVSGGAFGIDAAAHRGALAAGGATVVVLACGLDVPYPSAHRGLFTDIARDGLLVSELPPGTTPTRHRFLIRNRAIAALTRGTVVVEAARRSGALNTARHARDLHRVVMAVPGPVTSLTSAGCHALLREPHTVCVTDAPEVLEMVGLIGDDLAPGKRGPVLERDRLDPVTRDVLEAVPAREGAGTARIAVSAGVDLDTALARLGALSAGGFVERCPKGWKLRRPSPGP